MRLQRLTIPALPAVMALVGMAPACSKTSDTSAVDAAANAPHTTAASPSASAGASAAPTGASSPLPVVTSACKADVAPFVIDKAARGETGVTLVRLPDDRWAVGYAAPDGTPRVAVVLPEGSASVVDVDASKLPLLGQRPPAKTQRYVHRVTPLGAKDLKMRVAVDVAEVRGDGTRLVRCGPADEEPWLSFEGPTAYGTTDAGTAPAHELRDCRSFTAHGAAWAMGFEADSSAATAVDARWIVWPAATKLDDAHSLIEHTPVPAEPGRAVPRAGQLDRYGYTALTSASLDEAGYVLAARYNGKLRISKRAGDWSAAGKISDFWFGAAAGLPSMASRDKKVVVLVPLLGKLDLYGATFPLEGEPPKPDKLPMADPIGADPLPEGSERTALTTAIASHGQVVAAFLDGKPGKQRPRFVLFNEALKPQGSLFEPLGTGDADVADIKLAMLPDDRVLVTALVARPGAGLAVEGAVLSCGLATAAP